MRYLQTSDELLFESLINESLVYFSPNLRMSLKYLSDKNPIAKSLSEIEGQDLEADITFLDFGSEGYLTFQQMPKAMKLIKTIWSSAADADVDQKFDPDTTDILYRNDQNSYRFTGVWKGNRNQIKVGKVINKFLPGKYTESEIENFVNLMKTAQTYRGDLKLVEGDDIKFWYKSENYESLSGSLGNSCMKDSNDLNLYAKNPEVCKMLILVRNNKLAARALVWKLESSDIPGKPKWFMDRIYICKDADYQFMREEADKRGWSFRTRTSNSGYTEATYKGKEYDEVNMTVKVRPGDYKTYPYLDTFKRYVPRKGMLYNDEKYRGTEGIVLTSTQGSFTSVHREQGLIRRVANQLRDRLNPVPVVESVVENLFRKLNRSDWHQNRLSKGYDHFTESEMNEIEQIVKFRDIRYKSWKQLYCEYKIEIFGSPGTDLTISINKCEDEWFYISATRNEGSELHFEADGMEGLEDLLNTLISLVKNRQPLWAL